jgi:hypothetical protein
MPSAAWRAPTNAVEAAKRAGGRRRYNAARQRADTQRRQLLRSARLNLKLENPFGRGYPAMLA